MTKVHRAATPVLVSFTVLAVLVGCCQAKEPRVLRSAGTQSAKFAGLSRDGRTALMGGGRVEVWNSHSGKRLLLVDSSRASTLASDGRVAYVAAKGEIVAHDLKTNERTTIARPDRTAWLSASVTRGVVAAAQLSRRSGVDLTLFGATGKANPVRVRTPIDLVSLLHVSDDGESLFAGGIGRGNSYVLQTWKLGPRRGSLVGDSQTVVGHRGLIIGADTHRYQKVIVSVDSKSMLLVTASGGRRKYSLDVSRPKAASVIASVAMARGEVAIGYSDGRIAIWSWKRRAKVEEFGGHRAPVTAIAFRSDPRTGRKVLAGHRDGRVMYWQR